jgi:hypothetical protein
VKFEKEQKYVQGVMKKINKHFSIIGWVRHKWLQPTTIKVNSFLHCFVHEFLLHFKLCMI